MNTSILSHVLMYLCPILYFQPFHYPSACINIEFTMSFHIRVGLCKLILFKRLHIITKNAELFLAVGSIFTFLIGYQLYVGRRKLWFSKERLLLFPLPKKNKWLQFINTAYNIMISIKMRAKSKCSKYTSALCYAIQQHRSKFITAKSSKGSSLHKRN